MSYTPIVLALSLLGPHRLPILGSVAAALDAPHGEGEKVSRVLAGLAA